MISTKKIFRVFLASPNDLQDERKAVRNAVVECNEFWANVLGYHIELSGWEETVPGYGRPQDLINPNFRSVRFVHWFDLDEMGNSTKPR